MSRRFSTREMDSNTFKRLFLVACVTIVALAASMLTGFAYDKKPAIKLEGGLLIPTVVTLTRFDAIDFKDQVSIQWQSGYELDNFGYNVYREVDGERIRLNPSLIAGSALQAGPGVAMHAGNSYAWRDKLAWDKRSESTRYWLESVDLNLHSVWYGPITPRFSNGVASRPSDSGLFERLSAPPLTSKQSEGPAVAPPIVGRGMPKINDLLETRGQDSPEMDQQWVLASTPGVKIFVDRNGWLKVTRAELLANGLDQATDLTKLQLYTGGVEQAMRVNADGSIEFYGQALPTLSSESRVYWLISAATRGKRLETLSAGPFDPNLALSSFASSVERKDRTIRFAALLNGTANNFFGPSIGAAPPLNQTLQLSALDQSAAGALLEVGAQGLTTQAHQVRVQLNGVDVGTFDLFGRDNVSAQFNVSPFQLRENKNTIALTGIAGGSDVSLVDFVRITYPRRYRADNNRLNFSVASGQAVKIDGFLSSAVKVFDITDTANIIEMIVDVQPTGNGFAFTLPSAPTARTFCAIAGNANHPAIVTRNDPSSLHTANNAADFVIIAHKSLRPAIEPLRVLRQGQGLNVTIVDVADVYDEWNFGAPSPQAIKDFLLRAHTVWQNGPEYILLAGDGSGDPRNYLGYGGQDLVPTMMVDSVFSEAASDDSLADFDGDGIPEMAVGRLPVNTAQEATTVVNKIIANDAFPNGNTVQRGAVMVSDSPDANYDFEAMTLDVRTQLPAMMNVQFINRQAGTTQVIRAQILAAINQGPSIVNFLGHGSVGVWTGAALLVTDDAPNLTNGVNQSTFVMMTCLNGSFVEVGADCLGEALLKSQTGGAQAVWASSGLTTPPGQVVISKKLYEQIFGPQSIRLGDAIRISKSFTLDMDIRHLSVFFGDPTMTLH